MSDLLEQYDQRMTQIIEQLAQQYPARITRWHRLSDPPWSKLSWQAGGTYVEDIAKLTMELDENQHLICHYRCEGSDEDSFREVFYPNGMLLDIRLNLTLSTLKIEYRTDLCRVGSQPVTCHFNLWLLPHFDAFVGHALSRQPAMKQVFDSLQPDFDRKAITHYNWTYTAQLLPIEIPHLASASQANS